MHKLKKSNHQVVDANFKLPSDLTTTIIDALEGLTPCFRRDYLLSEVVSKYVSDETDPAVVRRNRAITKWLATERDNEATNVRLMTIDPGYQILPRVSYEAFMSFVTSLIASVIGEVVPEEVLTSIFSNGASTSRSRASSHASGKYTGKADVTTRAYQTALLLYQDSVLTEPLNAETRGVNRSIWADFQRGEELCLVDSNILFTVPKKTDIDRCACKEPDVNMYLQKGAGRFIRNALRREGINLNDQSRNQSLARIGSRDGSLATLDLSSASDSVCFELVYQALPVLWFSYLNDIRCHTTIIDGDVHHNEMFSSMGNGFTFELESLLFYAIAKAVAYFTGTSGTISVYGDDIIVPTQMYHDLTFALGVLGFKVNSKKSYHDGGFRESCGGHYNDGSCVTPFYIRGPIAHLHDLIVTANAVRKWSRFEYSGPPSGIDKILDCEVYPLWRLLAESVPRCFWGGYDHEDTSRLVSFQKPRRPKRLSPISPKRETGDGGYVYWHNLKELAPMGDPIESSSLAVFTGRYRSTKVGWDYKVTDHVFLTELVETEAM